MKTTLNSVEVYWEHEPVGTLSLSDTQLITFAYSTLWLRDKRQAISLSMPLRPEIYQREAQHFFGNLLPEGDFRRRIENLFKISADNDFSLLKAIGGDCAGALTIGTYQEPGEQAFYEPIPPEKLNRIILTEGLAGLGQAGQNLRLSLAGAQGKLPLRYRQKILEMPHGGAPSTHILKFNHQAGNYPKLVENEYLMNRIGHHLGLPVVDCQLLSAEAGTILIIERYDRSKEEWPGRWHQEDFCQALAYSYQTKYEKEGGPSFAQCIELARNHLSILDVNRLIDWYLFNLFLGNSDAHAKNISILYQGQKSGRLAPFYDLVCTRAYENLDRKLAMACGGEFDPDLVSIDNFRQMALEIGVTLRFLKARVRLMLEKIPIAVERAKADLVAQGQAEKDWRDLTLYQTKILNRFQKRLIEAT